MGSGYVKYDKDQTVFDQKPQETKCNAKENEYLTMSFNDYMNYVKSVRPKQKPIKRK